MPHRYWLVFILFVLSIITYLDRACISTAKNPIAADLGLSDAAMGLVFGAFALGYALAQIPGGWLADRYGPRLALAAVVAGWSVLTALTGAAWNLTSLVVIRFLFGAGEAGAFPGSSRALYNWLPVTERGRAHGIMFSGTRLGAAIAFPLLVWMLQRWSWRMSFVILGAMGVLWALFWYAWFRNQPPVPIEPPAALKLQPFGLREVFRTVRFLPAMAQYFAGNFTFFLCLSWMHPYLKQRYQLSDGDAATFTMLPLLFGASAQWTSGFVVDRLYRSSWRAWSRRLPGMVGFSLAAGGIVLAGMMPSAWAAAIFFTIATFGADMTISPSWAYCSDLAGKNAGSVSASMNMVGNIGSFVSSLAFPFLYQATGSAQAYFAVAATLNVGAILCWRVMRSPAGQAPA